MTGLRSSRSNSVKAPLTGRVRPMSIMMFVLAAEGARIRYVKMLEGSRWDSSTIPVVLIVRNQPTSHSTVSGHSRSVWRDVSRPRDQRDIPPTTRFFRFLKRVKSASWLNLSKDPVSWMIRCRRGHRDPGVRILQSKVYEDPSQVPDIRFPIDATYMADSTTY